MFTAMRRGGLPATSSYRSYCANLIRPMELIVHPDAHDVVGEMGAGCVSVLSWRRAAAQSGQQWPVQPVRIVALTANSAKPRTKNSNIALNGDLPSAVCGHCNAFSSTANAKGAGRRLDFNLTLVLRSRNKPESAARGLNGNTTAPPVWIVRKLVESNV